MTVSLELKPAFTQVGLDAVLNAQADGFSARITHFSFGDGGTGGYTPQGTETGLRGQRELVPITFSMRDGTGSFRVRGTGAPTPLEYWVREVGVVLEDGTLLALWSDPNRSITGRGPGAELEFDIKLVLDALPGDALEIVVTPGGDRTLTALVALTARAIAAERRSLEDHLAARAVAARIDDLEAGAGRARTARMVLGDRLATTEREVAEDRRAARLLGATLAAQVIRLTRITLPSAAT